MNGCLAREAFSDAHEIQNCILLLLDSMNGAQPLERPARMLLFRRMGDKLELLADRQRLSGEDLIANRFQHYADPLREIGSTSRNEGYRATLNPGVCMPGLKTLRVFEMQVRCRFFWKSKLKAHEPKEECKRLWSILICGITAAWPLH